MKRPAVLGRSTVARTLLTGKILGGRSSALELAENPLPKLAVRTTRYRTVPSRGPRPWNLPRYCFLPAATMITIFALLIVPRATAHDLSFTRTTVVLLPGGDFRIDMQVDLDALALGMPQDADDVQLMRTLNAMSEAELNQTVDDLRQTFLRRVRIRFDNEVFLPKITFPDQNTVAARSTSTMLGLTVRMTGLIPTDATNLSLQASRAFPPLHISFVDVRGHQVVTDFLNEMLGFDYGTPSGLDDDPESFASDQLGNLVTLRQILERGDRSEIYALDEPPPTPGRLNVISQYLYLGFEHILPLGLDHMLFVLSLFLLNTSWRPLLAQVTAFTAAHTFTLGLSTYGIVSLSPSLVEPLITLSIAWVAFENVITGELKPWRPAVVFGFGLLHGLGFAGVLAQLGLPPGEYLTALLSFNVGVELGQLAVILGAFLVLSPFQHRDWYRPRISIPLSLTIGVIGLYWTITRVFFP